jgi:galactose oxidase
MWSSFTQFGFEGNIDDPNQGPSTSQTYTEVFDPNTLMELVTTEGPADMFCPGIARLPDGRVLVNGGSSSGRTTIYDWQANKWTPSGAMNVYRGYNGDVLLQTGDVFTLGGSWSGSPGTNKVGEVWSQSLGGWTTTGISAEPIATDASGIPLDPADQTNPQPPWPNGIYRSDNHVWLFAASNGRIFHAGPSPYMNWITTSGSGSITSAGTRGMNGVNDVYSINGKAVMYDIGKILKVGGAPAYNYANATKNTYVIDINGASAKVQRPKAQMIYSRAFANAVALPNGQVFIVGGQTYAQAFSDDNSVLVPELWDPVSQTFCCTQPQLAPMQTPRNYHSTAVLLPDGRVFVGGGGQCGDGCPANHLNAEIYSPPYLFQPNGSPAPRPVISSAPSTAQRGSSISVTTNGPVSSFAVLRLSAATHSVDNDQRRVPLQIKSSPGKSNNYQLAISSDPGVVLPGYYMLFAINSKGTPSVAWMININ